ncbi:MAG: ABC transporter permease [Imperialibacter sp.]
MTKPPKILLWLLDRFCPPSRQDLKGDFLELYELRAEEWGRARANWRFLWDTLTVLPLHFFMKNNLPSQSSIAMFSHYVKIAFRGLSRSKVYSSINILGLAVGMGACLLIYQYISFELSYDRFHPNAGNTYRLTQTVEKNGEMRQSGVMAPLGLGAGARESIPEVRKVVRIRPQNVALTYINPENNERHQEDNMWYVDPGFLKMFDFPLKYGDKESALTEKYSMVLSEEMAFKYFGDTDPLEKTIRISGGTLSGDFVIKGVLERLPENTHLQFDVLISMQFVLENWRVYQQGEDWFYDDFVTYVVIDPMSKLDNTCH